MWSNCWSSKCFKGSPFIFFTQTEYNCWNRQFHFVFIFIFELNQVNDAVEDTRKIWSQLSWEYTWMTLCYFLILSCELFNCFLILSCELFNNNFVNYSQDSQLFVFENFSIITLWITDKIHNYSCLSKDFMIVYIVLYIIMFMSQYVLQY